MMYNNYDVITYNKESLGTSMRKYYINQGKVSILIYLCHQLLQ